MSSLRCLRIGIVGPLPPPSGGMAGQTAQLAALLRSERVRVTVVQTNMPYPRAVRAIRAIRAIVRLLPYLRQLWLCAGRVEVMHVMANSGWSWHLWVAPAILVSRMRRVPVVINYRGGEAEQFFTRSWRWVHLSLRLVQAIIVPSRFLQGIFAGYGVDATVVPNVVNVERFRPHAAGGEDLHDAPRLLVARNLEAIYDIGTALEVLGRLRSRYPRATLTIAGSGPEEARLKYRAAALGLGDAVRFVGRVEHGRMPALYRQADLMLNPSLVDNTPNSILEAWATRVPVVTTNVGGIRFLVDDERTALVVPPGDPAAMASAAQRALSDPVLRRRLQEEGANDVVAFSWPQVRDTLAHLYGSVVHGPGRAAYRMGAGESGG